MSFKIKLGPPALDGDQYEEQDTILERLDEANIISIEREGDLFKIREECDRFYSCYLTKPQMLELIKELTDMVTNA